MATIPYNMPQNFKIKKKSGKREYFSIQKLTRALLKTGINQAVANRTAHIILKKIKRGNSTNDIYKLAKQYLRKSHPVAGAKFTLREAIFRLGPAGYDFEKFIMLLFRQHGYNTYLPEILNGKCVTHEVDVVAEKDGKRSIMECKLRKEAAMNINIKETLATWARFMDLKEGAKIGKCVNINEVWLVTNSKFSNDSLRYGTCKNIKMLSWNTPQNMPLPAYIDSKNIYPITILNSIKRYHLNALSSCDILLLSDLVNTNYRTLCKNTSLTKAQLAPLINEAKEILSFN